MFREEIFAEFLQHFDFLFISFSKIEELQILHYLCKIY